MPYRTIDDRIDGVIITFFNITVNKKLEIELKEANKLIQSKQKEIKESEIEYRNFFESAKEGIIILNFNTGSIIDVNSFLIRLLGYSKEQFLEKKIWEIGLFQDIIKNKTKFLELKRKQYIRYENLPLETVTGKKINVEFISNVYSGNNQKIIQCFIREVSREKKEEQNKNQ
jgi:two-component system CheB/CheR fusion protein